MQFWTGTNQPDGATMHNLEHANRALWNELTPIHARSAFYDVAGFKSGKNMLRAIEQEEIGPVSGKTLLHLQCHVGLDTLSWARLGARVTGVDFAENAIELARSLSSETGLPADFVCSSVYDLPQVLRGQFDIVFTSYGVLCWLPDLLRWAAVIAHFLKSGGIFYIVEEHPFANIFYNEQDATELRIAYPYFHTPTPAIYKSQGSYADRVAHVRSASHEWTHSFSDVLNAVLSARLQVEYVHEFPFNVYRRFPFMIEDQRGWWHLPAHQESIPQLFSLRATKPY